MINSATLLALYGKFGYDYSADLVFFTLTLEADLLILDIHSTHTF